MAGRRHQYSNLESFYFASYDLQLKMSSDVIHMLTVTATAVEKAEDEMRRASIISTQP